MESKCLMALLYAYNYQLTGILTLLSTTLIESRTRGIVNALFLELK